MRLSILVVAIALLGSATFVSAQSGVAGDWTLTFNTPGGAREASATFKVDGDTLTGTLTGPQGELPFKGTVKGATFTFTLDVQTQQGTMSIGIAGDVDGDSMKGTMDFGQGTGDFTGTRKAK